MPGKSKKGGGLESSPVYKKQAYGEGVSPFTMRSGNAPPFKMMGSSPVKYGGLLRLGAKVIQKGVKYFKGLKTKTPKVKQSLNPSTQNPKPGETYQQYVNRAFKTSKDPYGQDVMSKRAFKAHSK